MRPIEADWLRERFLALGPDAASPIANIGSSTALFRESIKPHIEERLFAPLRAAGFSVVHVDMKAAAGVDMVGDLSDPAFRASIAERGCKSVICSNLLEHLSDPVAVTHSCEDLVGEGGLLAVTVPYSYPWHGDPIDTLYRPTPEEMATLFPRSALVEGAILKDGGLIAEERAKGMGHLLAYPFAAARRLLMAPLRPAIAKAQAHRLLWLFRQFSVSCAVFRVVR